MSKQSPTNQYCCIEMLDNVEKENIAEVVSGFYLPNKDTTDHCLDGNPKVNFCPFCGAEFETVKTTSSWDWRIKS